MEALHYTLEQMSRELKFPVGVVRQLARQFGLPKSYYNPAPGQPRLMLFDAAEASLLEQVQSLLASGYSLKETKSWFQQIAPDMDSVLEIKTRHRHEEDLTQYDQSDVLKKRLAENTFSHYRTQIQQGAPTLPIMLQRLKEKREHPLSPSAGMKYIVSKSFLLFSRLVPSTPVTMPETFHRETPWMTEALKQRARRLQEELMVR